MATPFIDRTRDGFLLTCDVSRISVSRICEWLSTEAYWAKGRDRATVERSIENSFVYAVLSSDGETVACARMVTDSATFGWVCDVFVDASHRGRGLGTWMVSEIVEHWGNEGLPRILLGTRDAHEVYARVGFRPLAHPSRMMEIDRRPQA